MAYDWKSYKGRPPWSLELVSEKRTYNEGDIITSSADPRWGLDDPRLTPITERHFPCGYWYKNIAFEAHRYITAICGNTTANLVAIIDYDTYALDPTSGTLTASGSTITPSPVVYNKKLYVWNLAAVGQIVMLNEYDLDTKCTTRLLPITTYKAGFGPGCLKGNMLYFFVNSISFNDLDPDHSTQLIEVNLDTFTVTRRLGMSYHYSNGLRVFIRGDVLYCATINYVISIDLTSFTLISAFDYAGYTFDGYSAAANHEKTECVVTRNRYSPCLMKISLTDYPTILATKNTVGWLPVSSAFGITADVNNNIYICDKFYMRIHKFNMTLWDTPVTYEYDSTYARTFQFALCDKDDLWLFHNYYWIDNTYKILRIKTATMEIDHVISLPNPPYTAGLVAMVIY